MYDESRLTDLPAIIGTGGGVCCIRVAAYLTACRDAGLDRAVDHAITVSGSGGAVGAYLSGLCRG
jgi:hypothetical protein